MKEEMGTLREHIDSRFNDVKIELRNIREHMDAQFDAILGEVRKYNFGQEEHLERQTDISKRVEQIGVRVQSMEKKNNYAQEKAHHLLWKLLPKTKQSDKDIQKYRHEYDVQDSSSM